MSRSQGHPCSIPQWLRTASAIGRPALGKLVREDRTEVVGVCSPTGRVAVTRSIDRNPAYGPSGSRQAITAGSLIVSQTRTSSRPWFFSTVRLAWWPW